jgi:hypothetical protein
MPVRNQRSQLGPNSCLANAVSLHCESLDHAISDSQESASVQDG